MWDIKKLNIRSISLFATKETMKTDAQTVKRRKKRLDTK